MSDHRTFPSWEAQHYCPASPEMRGAHMNWRPFFLSCASAAMMTWPLSAARAEFQISVYTGTNLTHDSSVEVVRPGGTNATFSDVPWDAKPFKPAPYYGARVTYWIESAPSWGVGVDYTHLKAYARLNEVVRSSGTISGVPLGANTQLSNFFPWLEFSDGLNLATAHVFYRHPFGRVTPYIGAGLGASIPHVEVNMPGYPNTFKYELTGIASRLYGGVDVAIAGGWSVFGEYQLSFAQIQDASLTGGGTLQTNLLSHHFNIGISYAFKPFW
jgi:lipid A oxidase